MATETIRTKILKVEQQFGSEWFDILVDHKIKRLGTKRRELALAAEQLRREGGEVNVEFTARPGRNINPHTNQPYMNYWFEGVEKATGTAATAALEIPVGDAPPTRKTDPGDAWRMCLNKGGELAVMTLEYMENEERTFEAQKKIAIGWAYFFMTQPFPDDEASGNGSAFQAPESVRQSSFGAYSEPDFASVSGDDDIPF